MVQWLRFHVSTSEGMGSVHAWGPKILHTMQQAEKKKKVLKKKILLNSNLQNFRL